MHIYVLCASDEPLRVRYVGKAVDVKKRVSKHLRECGLGTAKLRWIEAVVKRGAVIEWFVVETVDGDADAAERRWIAYYPAGQLTNSTAGGDGGATWKGRKHTVETRALMSAAQKGRPGHPISDEQKAKQSAALRGRKFSDEKRARYSQARRAYYASLTTEQRADLARKTTASRQASAAARADLVSCVACRNVMRARYATDRHRTSIDCTATARRRHELTERQASLVSCVACRRQLPAQMWHRHQGSKICVQAVNRMIQ